jgi:hypothetical protein
VWPSQQVGAASALLAGESQLLLLVASWQLAAQVSASAWAEPPEWVFASEWGLEWMMALAPEWE